jgi:hypothetical protein
LIEEECAIYVRAATVEDAEDKALAEAAEIADGIWQRSDCEPHTYSVDKCQEADKPKEFT